MAMTEGQVDAMNNYAEGLANAIYNEMAPSYFPAVMKQEDIADIKKYYQTLAKAFYKFTNGLTE